MPSHIVKGDAQDVLRRCAVLVEELRVGSRWSREQASVAYTTFLLAEAQIAEYLEFFRANLPMHGITPTGHNYNVMPRDEIDP